MRPMVLLDLNAVPTFKGLRPAMFFFRRFMSFLVFILLIATFFAIPAALATEGSGLPLPRFVSLRAGEVNLRTGPGVQYPVEWVYLRQKLPVEVIAEYLTWRKIRDWQGAQGWVHQSMVGGLRTIIITGNTRTLRREAKVESAPVALADVGVIGQILECPEDSGWCKVDIGGHKGWLRRVDFWGVHRDEKVE